MAQHRHPQTVIIEEDDFDNVQLSSLERSLRLLQHTYHNGIVVEVAPRPREQFSWQFLQVCDLYYDQGSNAVILRGIRITRTRNLRGMLPRFTNEVCALYDVDKEDNRPEDLQAAAEVRHMEVIRTRAFSKTNAAFPRHRMDPDQWNSKEEVENKGNLVQRWKFCRYWANSRTMTNKRSVSGALLRLRAADIEDEYFRAPDDILRNEFRGGIVRGGSYKDGQFAAPNIDLNGIESDQSGPVTLGRGQMYTADDMFCGAGGASRGIRQAGLRLKLACEFDQVACETYHKNFPEAELHNMNVFDFIELDTPTGPSDIVHLSPPCQTWSPAHTCAGKNDEANARALYACSGILQERRPRLSTGEQTFGLLFPRFEEYFNALVGQYTALGYSFSWDILWLKEYGLASTRRRLIWIASCPGEALPPFPPPTNSEDNRERLPLPRTLHSVLGGVGRRGRDTLHNVREMLSAAQRNPRFPREPYDDRCQIGTIVTAGTTWPHPSGTRNFTLRELACIQGFPMEHTFAGSMTQARRQIGNAFPPVVVEVIYRHLRDWLLRQDRVVPMRIESLRRRSIRAPERRNQQNVIVLDPVDEEMATLRPSMTEDCIVVDVGNVERTRNQWPSMNRTMRVNRSQTGRAIAIEESGDTNMVDLTAVDGEPSFSRESSRTLSAESLRSLIEMDVD
ncbi:S-adenosyl-L-methionine-dependent methyltransferase [Xylaria sp. FL0933]|nr:S-adenosyl-L-methionine-dependent methyltransferase [Xylaria sp. FL0933]